MESRLELREEREGMGEETIIWLALVIKEEGEQSREVKKDRKSPAN